MSLLLDTHVFLWWVGEPERLSNDARAAIARPDTPVFVSAASAWEIAIKRFLGRIDLRDEEFDYGLRESRFIELPVSARHGLLAGALPPHHRDPFDRMLVAQAMTEGLHLVTHDRTIMDYDIPTMKA